MIADVTFDERGLVPTIVQDAATGDVLMLAYSNEASLAATETTGYVHFWSRSRNELWRKGATSGNTLEVVDMTADCDSDAILIRAHPAGPTCHTGAASCFANPASQGFASLETLWSTIAHRAAGRPSGSYTAELIAQGVDRTGRKVVEEATETLLAAKDHAAARTDDTRVAEEAADLVYHLLVLLAERDIEPRTMLQILAARGK